MGACSRTLAPTKIHAPRPINGYDFVHVIRSTERRDDVPGRQFQLPQRMLGAARLHYADPCIHLCAG